MVFSSRAGAGIWPVSAPIARSFEPGGCEAGGRNHRVAAGRGAVFDSELGAAAGRHLEPALQLEASEAGVADALGAEIVEGDGAAVIDEAADTVGGMAIRRERQRSSASPQAGYHRISGTIATTRRSAVR